MNDRLATPLLSKLESRLRRLERRTWFLVLAFVAIYVVGFSVVAAQGLITNDELFTIYIARLPGLQSVWNALATGVEQTPPLIYLVTRADFALLGNSPLAIRLPELLGFLTMCVCLFQFVSRRSSASYGFIAMLLPLMTNAYKYAFFARAYALVLGFSAIALICWQWAAEGRHRVLALVGLAVSLAAAVSSHYYAVLSLFPLVLGEVVRSLRRKKIDVGVWLALVLSLSPLLFFLPLIESARKFAHHFWSKPHWSSMASYYQYFLLPPAVGPLLAIFLVIVCYVLFGRTYAVEGRPQVQGTAPLHEWAAVVGYLMIPFVGIILAKAVVGAYEQRCALAAVIGLSVAVAWGLYSIMDARLTPAFGLGILLCILLVAKQVQTYHREIAAQSARASTYTFLEAHAEGDTPIVISNPQAFMELTYDPPRDIGRRFLYLSDPRMGLQYTGTDDVEQGLVEMKRWAGLNVQPFRHFVESGRQCYILFRNSDYPNQYEWVIPALEAANWRISLINWQDGRLLFSVIPGGQGTVPTGNN